MHIINSTILNHSAYNMEFIPYRINMRIKQTQNHNHNFYAKMDSSPNLELLIKNWEERMLLLKPPSNSPFVHPNFPLTTQFYAPLLGFPLPFHIHSKLNLAKTKSTLCPSRFEPVTLHS